MDLYILAIISLIVIVLFFKIQSVRIIYLRKLGLPILCILFIISLVFFSDTAVRSASKGINLWFNIVFPSLFPFFVGSDILNRTGFVKAMGVLLEPIMRPLFNVPGCGSFAFALGITSGYPVGAKITTDLREKKLLSKTEGERLLAFTNNSGPLFIIGAVAVGMFKMPQLGLFLLGSHIIAGISVGILFRFYGKTQKKVMHKEKLFFRFKKELLNIGKDPSQKDCALNFGSIFGDAIKSSVLMMLTIGGFIILFSVIVNLLIEFGLISYISNLLSVFLGPVGISKEIITATIGGFFEITTGTNMSSEAVNVPLIQQLTAASLIIGWAGLSVHSQVLSIVSKTDISIKPYLLGKFLQGVFSALYTFIGIKIAGSVILKTKPAFSQPYTPDNLQWHHYLLNSFENLMISLAIIIILLLISLFLNIVCTKNT